MISPSNSTNSRQTFIIVESEKEDISKRLSQSTVPHENIINDSNLNSEVMPTLPSQLVQNFIQFMNNSNSVIETITTEIVEELVTLFIKILNEGKSHPQRCSILNDYLESHGLTLEEIHIWLANKDFTNEETNSAHNGFKLAKKG
ncbi:14759_t:CDS:2 [Funneliformis mosseae]|uniref:14759_t:CDS:1 n=1 Tax=Funneliformis mosseae TaxID=27381 RepID=A0A9N9CIF0_FUNMO|nr:14759_t:CDS:2 [Funneliformis mosseae]